MFCSQFCHKIRGHTKKSAFFPLLVKLSRITATDPWVGGVLLCWLTTSWVMLGAKGRWPTGWLLFCCVCWQHFIYCRWAYCYMRQVDTFKGRKKHNSHHWSTSKSAWKTNLGSDRVADGMSHGRHVTEAEMSQWQNVGVGLSHCWNRGWTNDQGTVPEIVCVFPGWRQAWAESHKEYS